MKQQATTGIVLARTNFGEADRIITFITPDFGKIKVMARGVRKVKSKLAGGIELFSVSSISFLQGKKDIGTLISTRLQTNYSRIVEDIDRTMVGYDLIKILNKTTQDEVDAEYYELLLQSLASLNDTDIDPQLTKCWFISQLLVLLGHSPNLEADTENNVLDAKEMYQFDYQSMSFRKQAGGKFSANHIKVLRLLTREQPSRLRVVSDLNSVLPSLQQLLTQILQSNTI